MKAPLWFEYAQHRLKSHSQVMRMTETNEAGLIARILGARKNCFMS